MAELTSEQKKKNKMIMIVVVVVLVLLVSTLVTVTLVRKYKDKKALEKASENIAKDIHDNTGVHHGQTEPLYTPHYDDAFPLKIGSQGENVTYLQNALNLIRKFGMAKLPVDGNFGKGTYTAVITWAGTKYYPVTVDHFNEIMALAKNAAG